MIKNSLLLSLSSLCILGCSSSGPEVSGTGSNTGNAFVVGIATKLDGSIYDQTNAQVALIKSSGEVRYDTLSVDGKFTFSNIGSGSYSIQIDDTLHGTGYLYQNIPLNDTLSCKMSLYGAVNFEYNGADFSGGELFIPGTLIKHTVASNSVRSDIDEQLLPRFPATKYDSLCYRDENGVVRTVTDTFTVKSSETVKVTSYVPVANSQSFNAGLPSNGVNALTMDSYNRLLVGTDNGYVGIYDDSSWAYIDIFKFGVYSSVTSMAVDLDSSLWCGTYAGVLHFGKQSVTHYSNENSGINGNDIRSIIVDSLGNKWFSSYDGGISMKQGDEWKIFTAENSKFPSDVALDLTADREAVWAITSNGIARFRNGEWYTFNSKNAPFSTDSMSAMFISEDVRWFAAADGSLYLQTEGWWKRFDDRNSILSNNKITALFVDSDGTLWAANDNSEIYAYRQGKWILFSPDNSTVPIKCGIVESIVEQENGNIFIATENQGVIQLEK